MPELQKLCLNCQHFEFEFSHDWGVDGDQAELAFRCDQDRYDLKNRPMLHGQFVMYMYMGQKCDHFRVFQWHVESGYAGQVLNFTGPKGRAGLPSGELFGGGGLLQVDPPPKSDDIPQR